MFAIRPAVAADVAAIGQLIRELAAYERMPDAARATDAQLHAALFGPHPAVFSHVAEADGEVAGFSLWFRSFSTWEGVHGIYLEDLYVRPEYRGSGVGKALLTTLAETAVANGYARLEWSVLDWNDPAIRFYESVGARPQSEWTVYRLTGNALASLGCRTKSANSTTAPATPAPMRFTP